MAQGQSDGNTRSEWQKRADTLRKMRLPASVALLTKAGKRSGTVSAAAMLAVLRSINDHAGDGFCWLKHETIAKETGYVGRTVKRACEALRRLRIIRRWRQKTPRGTTCNHFAIVWPVAEEFTGTPIDDIVELPFPDDDQSDTEAPTKVTSSHPPKGHQGTDQSDTEAPTKVTSRHSHEAPHEAPHGSATRKLKNEAPCGDDGDSENRMRGRHLEVDELIDPVILLERFEAAADAGIVYVNCEHDLLSFFAWGHYCWRYRKKVDNPIGLFYSGLRAPDQFNGEWNTKADDEHDIAWARKALRKLSLPPAPSIDADLLRTADAGDDSTEQRRQAEAMALAFGRAPR